MKIGTFTGLVAASLLVVGCASNQPRPEPPQPLTAMRTGLFVSPSGKVFRGPPGTEPPVASWFREADVDSDGLLTLAEFKADFTRQFATLDSDGDGEIGPVEVSVYENETLPEMASFSPRRRPGAGERPTSDTSNPESRQPVRTRGGRMAGGGLAMGAARFGLLAIPHPIMAADSDFNRGVTRAEWERAAGERFALLKPEAGRLTLQGLLAPHQPVASSN